MSAWQQCGSAFAGRGSIVFCCRCEGHDGDHRGSGKQWTQRGKRVSPPTMTMAEAKRLDEQTEERAAS